MEDLQLFTAFHALLEQHRSLGILLIQCLDFNRVVLLGEFFHPDAQATVSGFYNTVYRTDQIGELFIGAIGHIEPPAVNHAELGKMFQIALLEPGQPVAVMRILHAQLIGQSPHVGTRDELIPLGLREFVKLILIHVLRDGDPVFVHGLIKVLARGALGQWRSLFKKLVCLFTNCF